jgi:hypothetical protein
MTIDANAILSDELRRILSPAELAAVHAYCGVNRVTLSDWIDGVVTRPGGAFDRIGLSVEQVASLPTNGSPIAILTANALRAARVE